MLGAGIQGCSAAIALAASGWSVTVIDRGSQPFLGASRRGEGKIHLGYVYANEPTRATAALMVEGALAFAASLDSWLPSPVDWPSLLSTPFTYAVPESSMVSVERLAEHYAWVDDLIASRLRDDPTAHYLGSRSVARADLLVPVPSGYSPAVVAAFTTAERAVDPTRLGGLLTSAMAERGVRTLTQRVVEAVERGPHGFCVHTTPRGEHERLGADIVVNCLWDGRLAVDATLGISPQRPWVYRLKHGVVGRTHTAIPSTTVVLGPYGDVVTWPDGRAYASWYPDGMTGWSSDLIVPAEWRAAMAADENEERSAAMTSATLAGVATIIPGASDIEPEEVGAGVIVAWGSSDIDDPSSALHGRHDIGVHAHDGYFSIDTGKLTTAPLFAGRLVDLVSR